MRRLIVALIVVLCAPTPSYAWGAKGHKIVAEIALSFLSDNARDQVEDLLGSSSDRFIDASLWADQVRSSRPATAPWHFVDIPFRSGIYDPAQHCRNDDCIIPRIADFAQIAADKQVTRGLRIEALKWVIHFVGDIHQPLHAADDNDRGGNEVWVRIGGRTDRLHGWWDTGLVNELGGSPNDIAEVIIAEISDQEAKDWSQDTPREWALESFGIARDFIYARSRGQNTREMPIILPNSYIEAAIPIVARRLAMAGVRLAWILNQHFNSADAKLLVPR